MNRRKSSNPYVTRGRLQFRLFQILLNAIALLIIAGNFENIYLELIGILSNILLYIYRWTSSLF